MKPLAVSALCLASFAGGIAAMLTGGYLWLDHAWRR